MGRKNWIHVGSAQAGPKIAGILSVVENCKRLRLRIRDYLAQILPGLANLSVKRLDNLTATTCAARKSINSPSNDYPGESANSLAVNAAAGGGHRDRAGVSA